MRILVANKFWYRRGGLERVLFDEMAWLEQRGHQLVHFSTTHPSNEPSPWSDYFVPYLELGGDARLGAVERLTAAVRLFDNRPARRLFARLLDDTRPDVVHVHGIHRQLSPSILLEARERGIPVVQSLHDYHHVCPADVLLCDGAVCDPRRCGKYSYSAAVRHRCVRGSLAASALSAAETSFQRVRGVYERCVSRFVSPSRFVAERMVDGGWAVPTDVVPNAVPLPARRASASGDFVLVAGRLAAEKGVEVALEAARRAGVRAVVAGTGPEEARLRRSFPDADFRGHLTPGDLEALASEAMAAVVPSLWFENAPLAVLEAMALGVPVVASAVGGVPEIVTDGVTGRLVKPGDVDDLSAAIAGLAADVGERARIAEAARRDVAERFSPEQHTDALERLYEAVSRRCA